MNGFYVDTVPVEKQKKERGFGKRITITIVNNINACVGVCLYFDSIFIKLIL